MPRFRLGAVLAHEVADPLGVDGLAGLEVPGGAAPQPADQLAQLFLDDLLAHDLVRELGRPVGEEVVVKEVAEGAVADVVEQPGHPEQLLEERRRWRVRELRAQRGVKLLGEAPGQVHGAERVLEAAVLGSGEHPARGLELRHAPQSLHPRRIDQVFLGGLAGEAIRPRVEDVAVNGIGDEPAASVGIDPPHG
jgi:hypothetical protein